jgi:tetratricopeptide (TPR) repeat protein
VNWDRYLRRKRERHRPRTRFIPENQAEAKQALALGIIGISEYVEFSLTMEPLVDRVHDPDPVVRREAIRKIAEHRTPAAVRMLREMLLDEDEEVRLYAASELDRLESELQERMQRLRRQLEEDPLDIQARFELAKINIEFARLLLADSDLRHLFLDKAIELLDENLQRDTSNPQYYFYRGWAHRLQANYKAALADLKRAVVLDKRSPKAFVLLAEIYFQLGNYDLVKKIMAIMPVGMDQIEEYHAHLLWKD